MTAPLTPPPAPNASAPAPQPRGVGSTIVMVLVIIFSGAYLINPTLGIFEFLPDNLPVVGNLDEVFFTLAFVSGLAWMGVKFPFLDVRRHHKF